MNEARVIKLARFSAAVYYFGDFIGHYSKLYHDKQSSQDT